MGYSIVFGEKYLGSHDEVSSVYKDYIFKVHEDISDIKNGYIKLGYHLNDIKRNGIHERVGYTDFYDFCEWNYGLGKSEVSRCMNVWERFSKKINGVGVMEINPQYSKYCYSQLIEMLPLDDDDIKRLTPDMTIKDLREYKKNKRNSDSHKAKTNSLITVETDTNGCDVATEKVNSSESCDVETPEMDLITYDLSDIMSLEEEFHEHLERCKASGNKRILKRNVMLSEALFLLYCRMVDAGTDEIKGGD